jgi:hypothetical protein
MPGVFSRPVNFQIAQHDMAVPFKSEINEGIRHEHADGVEHVRVVLAVSDNQYVLRIIHDLPNCAASVSLAVLISVWLKSKQLRRADATSFRRAQFRGPPPQCKTAVGRM